MQKLEKASIPESEVVGTAKGWLDLWKQGDTNTHKVVIEELGRNAKDESEAYQVLLKHCELAMRGSVFMNDKYQVVRHEHNGLIHLSIKRLDKSPLERDWRDYQQIKNELIGEECEAIELFPAESRLVDCANQFHLWGWSDSSIRVPVGFGDRMVSESPVGKARQRPFERRD